MEKDVLVKKRYYEWENEKVKQKLNRKQSLRRIASAVLFILIDSPFFLIVYHSLPSRLKNAWRTIRSRCFFSVFGFEIIKGKWPKKAFYALFQLSPCSFFFIKSSGYSSFLDLVVDWFVCLFIYYSYSNDWNRFFSDFESHPITTI